MQLGLWSEGVANWRLEFYVKICMKDTFSSVAWGPLATALVLHNNSLISLFSKQVTCAISIDS
jgi:hypothetical protein